MTRFLWIAAALPLALALALPCGSAVAQTDSALPIDSAAANQNTSQRPLWELGIGVAGLRLPDYRGSDQSNAYLLPSRTSCTGASGCVPTAKVRARSCWTLGA